MKGKMKLTKTKYIGGMNYQKWDAYLILFNLQKGKGWVVLSRSVLAVGFQ